MNLNKTFVLGRLTQDPLRKQLPSGQPVVNFGIATNRYYTTQAGEKREEVEFHNIVIFGKLAETASQYLRKGSLVLIEGRLRTRNWDDSAGIKHYKTEVVAERMQLGPRSTNLGAAGSGFQPSAPAPAPVQSFPQPQVKTAVSDEEIPVIEEGPVKPEPKPAPETQQENKPEPANNPSNNPTNNPLSNNDQEIDVKQIPF